MANTMNAKQVMDIRATKGITTAQSNEHFRRWTKKGWQRALEVGNYDPTRTRLNFEVTKGGKIVPVDKNLSLPQRMAASLAARGIADPNEGKAEPYYRTVVNIIFGGSNERMNELAFGSQEVDFNKDADNSHIERCRDIEGWARDIYSFVSEKYGEENIVAFVVHLDEKNPHVHCTLLPIQDKKFAYKKLFAGKDKYEFSARMKQLHSELAEVNRKWGLVRGTSITETGAKHRSTEEYRRFLSEQCSSIEQEIVQHQKALAALQAEIRLAERRVKGLTTMVDNLRRQKADKEAQLSALNRSIKDKEGDMDAARQAKETLEREISAIEGKLADKQMKLDEAEQKLSTLQEDMNAVSQRKEELKAEAGRYADDVQSKAINLLTNVFMEQVIKDFPQQLDRLSSDNRQIFEGSFLQTIADRGTDVMQCAVLLFLGMVDEATTFAANRGGGGGGNSSGWGRDDDEDYRQWARRCMMMASRMMRPATGKKPKR